MKNNRILQIVDSLNLGGTERMSVNIFNGLSTDNVENILVVSRNIGPLYNFISDKSRIHFLNKKNFFDLVAFFRLVKLVYRFQPTLVHCHQTSIYWVFFLKIFFPRIKVIWHDHWGFSDLLKDSDRKLVKFFSFMIDGVVCVNDKIVKWNRKNLKVSNDKIVYIPNFPFLEQKEKKRNKVPVVLCLANFRDQKDHLNLVEAGKYLKDRGIRFKMLLAGAIIDTDYVKKVQKYVVDFDLVNEIEILGPVDNAVDFLYSSDVGVLSSVSEGLPVSLLEYGLAGLPVVCTDVGQCGEVLGFGQFGWLVPPKSSVLLADALEKCLINPDKGLEMGEKLKNNVVQNYGYKNFNSKYIDLIEKL